MTMQGLKHNPKTLQKMRVKAKARGNNGVGKQLKGIPRPNEVLKKMKPTMFKKGQTSPNKGKPNLKLRGVNHWAWKGGITPINRAIRVSLEYKIWRRAVFERDNYACIWCGVKSSKGIKVMLNADHIKPFALFPELRFAIDNGRTLCTDCHLLTDTYGSKSKR